MLDHRITKIIGLHYPRILPHFLAWYAYLQCYASSNLAMQAVVCKPKLRLHASPTCRPKYMINQPLASSRKNCIDGSNDITPKSQTANKILARKRSRNAVENLSQTSTSYFQLECTFPVSSCDCKRSACALRRLKPCTRANMDEDRLSIILHNDFHGSCS